MQLSVVILAAGQGKRMNSDLPKVLQPLAGEPLLQHVISAARALNPSNVYVVYGHGGAQVQAALHEEPVEWVLQADQLGTGHAVMQAMCLIPDEHTVLVLYGDVPLISAASLSKLIAAADAGALAILSVNLDEAHGYGRIVRNADGQVDRDRRTPATQALRSCRFARSIRASWQRRRDACASGCLGLGRNNTQREYFLTDVVAGAANAAVRIEAIPAASALEVAGVNDKIQLSEVEAGLRRQRAEELMLAGATLADPARIDIRGDIQVGRDVFIDINAVLIGKVHLAAGVKVGPNCVIAHSRIGEGTEIFANSVIDHAVVAQNCRIGPFARLRPGTVMHAEVHIGNFVEIKNTEIGAGSKANHLTYLGDSRVGKDVNVGAGSITCNYDGANKWPTFIDDGASIGSGTMMVAPVRIGAGSTTGAGSTISSSTPDNKLTFERSKQITKEAWTRPVKLGEKEKAEFIARKIPKPKA